MRTIVCTSEVLLDDDGSPELFFGAVQDVTDLRRAQEDSFAMQKLESLGTLASGIAHDFNNLLGAVLAQAELAIAGLAAGILSARGVGGDQGGRDPWLGHRPSTDDLCRDRE